MTKCTISARAISAFYSAPCILLISAQVYPQYQAALPEALAVFVLTDAGQIALPLDADAAVQDAVPLTGMAIGLKAIIAVAQHQVFADEMIGHCKRQNMFELPSLHILDSSWKPATKPAALSFLTGVLADYNSNLLQQLGAAQKQITHLRTQYEELWLGFEKSRRMIQGIGYNTRSIAFALEPGEQLYCPDTVAACFRQYLPADLAGFAGIELFVAEQARGDAQGQMLVTILRAADNANIATVSLPYADIEQGWLMCSFQDLVRQLHGDAILEVVWQGAGGPKLSLADMKAERFGDDAAVSLAMRLQKGLADPALLEKVFPCNLTPLVRQSYSAVSLLEQGRALITVPLEMSDPSAALGTDSLLQNLVHIDTEAGSVQTHAVVGQATGLRVASIVLPAMKQLTAHFKTAHAAGPHCLYIVAAVPARYVSQDIEALIKKIQSEGPSQHEQTALNFRSKSGALNGGYEDAVWAAQISAPDMLSSLLLSLLPGTEQSRDLIVAVIPLSGHAEYAHCRWLSFEVGYAVNKPHGSLPPAAALLKQGQQYAGEIQTYKLPALASDIQFYNGAYALGNLTDTLGFSPIILSEETGTLQTHPLENEIPAAILSGGVPIGARSISCQVATAHPNAASFTYILAVLPVGDSGAHAHVEHIVTSVAEGNSEGTDVKEGVQWVAKTIPALEKYRLELRFKSAVQQTKNVMFAVVPAGGGTAYGWCRWYSFDVVSSVQGMQVAHFEPASVQSITQ